MKSIVLSVILCLGLVVSLHAAAVEPVVEELQTDASVNPTAAADVDIELMTNEGKMRKDHRIRDQRVIPILLAIL